MVAASASAQSAEARQVQAPQPVMVSSNAVANLNITPRRVVFDAAKRTEAVFVFNQGTAPVTVDVALIDNIMLPSGEIVPVRALGDKGAEAAAVAGRLRSARELILATPSRLTLLPGKGKTIRLRATVPTDDKEAGERRTHLTVTTVPPAETGLTAEAAAAAAKGELIFRIQSVFGISIPLIVRNGAVNATATIGTIALTHADVPAEGGMPARRQAMLSFDLSRTGPNSVFGNFEATVGKDKGAQAIGFIRGIAVYPEIDARRVSIPLSREPRAGETIMVTFSSDDGRQRTVFASGKFVVP